MSAGGKVAQTYPRRTGKKTERWKKDKHLCVIVGFRVTTPKFKWDEISICEL